MHQNQSARNDGRRNFGDPRGVLVVTSLWVAITLALCVLLPTNTLQPEVPVEDAPLSSIAKSGFIFNALFVPALDADAMPLRWVDPRPAMRCDPDTTVRVNGAPLVPGALVPVAPFDLEWEAEGCHPFGARGPRVEGRVRMTVFREEWGFSALIEPDGLRAALPGGESVAIPRTVATMPRSITGDEPVGLALIGAGRRLL